MIEQREYVPFMSTVTMNVKFINKAKNPVDPDIVELHWGSVVYTDEITRLGIGEYTFEIDAIPSGSYRRIWVGKNDDNSFYAESRPKTYIVEPSGVI